MGFLTLWLLTSIVVVGNPFIEAILYKIMQDDAIINQTEGFKAATIYDVAEEKQSEFTQKLMENMI